MAHKLFIEENSPVPSSRRRFQFPKIEGRFGVALYLGGHEYFVGLAVNPVSVEEIVKKRFIKTSKAIAKVFRFDPLA